MTTSRKTRHINHVLKHERFYSSIKEGENLLLKEKIPYYITPGASDDRFILGTIIVYSPKEICRVGTFFIVHDDGYQFEETTYDTLENMLKFYEEIHIPSQCCFKPGYTLGGKLISPPSTTSKVLVELKKTAPVTPKEIKNNESNNPLRDAALTNKQETINNKPDAQAPSATSICFRY